MTRVQTARSIADLKAQLRQIIERATALWGHADADALGRRPAPASWSAAECLAHLNLSVDPYLTLWRHVLSQSPTEGAREAAWDRHRLDLWGRILVWTLEPPPRFRFPAPPAFQPVSTGPVMTLLPAFLERQQAMLDILGAFEAAPGVPIDRIKITSPFDRRVRYSVWSSLCVAAAHERRHLWQAEQAIARQAGGSHADTTAP